MKISSLYHAIIQSVTGRMAVYIVQFFALTLYARMFTPEEFGIIASIQVFVTFFQILSDIGIGPAVISLKNVTERERNGIFTVTFIVGMFLSGVFYLFSYALNGFYGGFKYQDIALVICINILFSSLTILPQTGLNKDAKFITTAKIGVFSELIALCGVLILYSFDYGVLALASKIGMQSISKFLLTYLHSVDTSLGKPKFGKEVFHIKKILSFSLYQFGFNFINYFSRNLDNILIGKYFGMSTIGIYSKSYELMRYPLLVTTFALTPAIQPILTKFRDDKHRVVKEHNILTSRLLALSIPISVYLFFNSHDVVTVLFGTNWVSVAPLIKIFSFMVPVQAVLSTSGSFFQVMNNPRLLFYSGFVAAMFSVTAIVLGVVSGSIENVAIFLVIAFLLNFMQIYYVLFKFCFMSSISDFMYRVGNILLCSILPIAFYSIIYSQVNDYIYSNVIFRLLVHGITMISIFIICYFPIRKILL